jgi:putative peptidoglycan lipid II flippase
LRSLSGFALLTLLVRGIGLLSQAIVLATLGPGAELDAFLLALVVPNLITAPYAGATELAIGPEYARARVLGPATAASIRWAILRRTARTGAIVTAILLVAKPAVITVATLGADEEVRALAQELAWWIFPSIGLTFVAAGCSTMLIAAGRIQVPIAIQAIRPLLLAFAVRADGSPTSLAVAVLVGAVVELAVYLLVVHGFEGGFHRRAAGDEHPDLAGVHTRGLVASATITQMAPAVDSVIAASLGPGKLAIYSVASRFYDVGKAAFLQPNARLAQNRLAGVGRDVRDLSAQVRFELRRAVVVGSGALVALAVGAPLCIFLVFRRDEFTTADARSAAAVSLVLAMAMVPWALASVLPRVLVAQGRARAYAMLSVVFVVANVALDLLLVQVWGLLGVAAATLLALVVFVAAQLAVVRRSAGRLTPPLEDEEGPEGSGDAAAAVFEAGTQHAHDLGI